MEQLGRELEGDALIGESWELADLSQSSPGDGGSGAQRSVIRNGELAGMMLQEAITRFGSRLMGTLATTAKGEFPLLVKFLDAAQNLSVQVHPSPAYADAHQAAYLKSEAWYIVDAEPGAAIYKGMRSGVTPDAFAKAIETGDAQGIESLLIKVPVKRGDCHYLPSGTCHALGAGVLAAEVQTPSDTTFRVFDWGRTGRQLHIEQAMQCIEWGPPRVVRHEKRTHIAGIFTTVSQLVECEHFRLEKVRMSQGYEQQLPYDQPSVWMVLEGAGRITTSQSLEPVTFSRGQTLLMPAVMDEAKVLLDEDTVWLEITFPQAYKQQLA